MATQDDLGKLEQSLSQALTDAVNSLREGLKDQEERNFDHLTKINDSLASLESQNPLPSGLSNRTPQFRGELDDAVAFLQHFDLYTTFHGYDDKRSLLLFPMLLTDDAFLWFSAIEPEARTTLKDLIKLFEARFLSQTDTFRLRHELSRRQQLPHETVTSYASDIKKRCQRLKLTEQDQLHYFLTGLKPDLQSFVILKEPKTLEEAERYAKLKSSLPSQPTFSASEVAAIKKSLVDELTKATPKPQVSAVQNDNKFDHRQSRNEGARSNKGIRDLIQQELAKLNKQNQGYSQRGPSNSYYPRSGYRQNFRGDFSYRDTRTSMGQIVCQNCGRIGHHQRQCRNRNDPRVPQMRDSQNRNASRPQQRQGFQ